MRKSKKGDLSLSINAIVILILAITMLGLGLAFMRNIFGSATKEFQEVGGTVKKQMIDQMKESNKVVELSNPKVTMKSGEQKQVYIGFKNEGNSAKDFRVRYVDANLLGNTASNKSYSVNVPASTVTSAGSSTLCGIRYIDSNNASHAPDSVYLELKTSTTNVKGGDVVVIPINIKSTSTANPGTCIFELKIDSNADTAETTPPGQAYDKLVELTVDITS